MDLKNEKWFADLEGYIRQGEPSRAKKSAAWQTAIGLQDVDGLKTSDYLLETAKEHIEGKIDIAAVQQQIQSYYEAQTERREKEHNTKEADVVSARIAALLGEDTFQFSPAAWQAVHQRLFSGLLDHAGEFRTFNISKKEWVLGGESVTYAAWESIRATVDYDFQAEKQFSYAGVPLPEAVRHIAAFTSGIWQIHPFSEGNTRATAVFVIKYLKTFGFPVSNEIFAENAWYFRNALVRANYNNYSKGIRATTVYLEHFFENLLSVADNDLRNRELHVDYAPEMPQSAESERPKCKNCTLEEFAVLRLLSGNPKLTQKELALAIGKSERTVKTVTVQLQEKGMLRRKNGRRNGKWEVLCALS